MSFLEAPYLFSKIIQTEEIMGRREMREHIFKLLFVSEFNEVEEMPQQMQLYFDSLEDLKPLGTGLYGEEICKCEGASGRN